MTIPEIASAINKNSCGYDIGGLQEIRKSIKHMDRRAGSLIFDERTIKNDWAFHYGGRTEIQFNIGLEKEGIRYGLAFSLETSLSLPDVSILYPKILKLNCLIQEEPELFSEYEMWHWQHGVRSSKRKVNQIEQQQIGGDTFIFFGKVMAANDIDIHGILQVFDKLLKIYKLVEESQHQAINENETHVSEFVFKKKKRNLPQSSCYAIVEKAISITVRHSLIQLALLEKLEKEYKDENVSLENDCRGNRIDIVVKHNENYYFYEVKVGITAKSCIRQAMGQILEYAYGNCKKEAAKIYVVGEPYLDNASKNYLNFLNAEFNIPINYLQITL
jgi:hypothetical protein